MQMYRSIWRSSSGANEVLLVVISWFVLPLLIPSPPVSREALGGLGVLTACTTTLRATPIRWGASLITLPPEQRQGARLQLIGRTPADQAVPHLWQVDAPDRIDLFHHRDTGALLMAVSAVEEAELNSHGVLGKQRKIHPAPIPGGTHRVG
jgi:hypothetical protein